MGPLSQHCSPEKAYPYSLSNNQDVTVYLILFTFRKAIDGRQRIVLPPGINKDDPLLVFLPTAGVHSENDKKGWYFNTVTSCLYTVG